MKRVVGACAGSLSGHELPVQSRCAVDASTPGKRYPDPWIEGASPSRYAGTVPVIRSKAEFDVLVCPATSLVWSVLFSSVGVLVTDSGGVLL